MIEEMAAASAAVKFGSAAMAAVAAVKLSDESPFKSWDVWTPENFDWLNSACVKIWGNSADEVFGKLWLGFMKGSWSWFGGGCSKEFEFGFWVKSSVTVGNGAEAEMVAMLEEQGKSVLARKFAFIKLSALDIEPDKSIRAADEVVDAIAMAAGGKGWLWLPS